MKYLKIMSFVLLIVCILSCSNDKNSKMIIGDWAGREWLIEGRPSNRNVAETAFTFDDRGNYTFTYAGTEEAGSYKVENELLFTKPAGKLEIMVRIAKLTKDSLVFDMNRSGVAEMLTLVRTK